MINVYSVLVLQIILNHDLLFYVCYLLEILLRRLLIKVFGTITAYHITRTCSRVALFSMNGPNSLNMRDTKDSQKTDVKHRMRYISTSEGSLAQSSGK